MSGPNIVEATLLTHTHTALCSKLYTDRDLEGELAGPLRRLVPQSTFGGLATEQASRKIYLQQADDAPAGMESPIQTVQHRGMTHKIDKLSRKS